VIVIVPEPAALQLGGFHTRVHGRCAVTTVCAAPLQRMRYHFRYEISPVNYHPLPPEREMSLRFRWHSDKEYYLVIETCLTCVRQQRK
jgi:hypothetical protein